MIASAASNQWSSPRLATALGKAEINLSTEELLSLRVVSSAKSIEKSLVNNGKSLM
jgi:hypothetical protein